MSLILIDKNATCFCSCAMPCVVIHKSGTMKRCTKEEIEGAGYKTIQVYGAVSDYHVHKAISNDGYEHKIQIRDKKYEKETRR